MDLKNIIFNREALSEFIDTDFKNCNFNRIELCENNHPLCFSEFNKELVDTGKEYKIFSIPINEMYAYKKDSDSFSLYLLIDVDKMRVNTLIDGFGVPENVSSEEVLSAKFDFLMWETNRLNIWLSKDFFGNYVNQVNNKAILIVTNMGYSNLINRERIF